MTPTPEITPKDIRAAWNVQMTNPRKLAAIMLKDGGRVDATVRLIGDIQKLSEESRERLTSWCQGYVDARDA